MVTPVLSPPADSTHEPELRRVTVLFADIQGSTALIQDLDPEDAAGLIDPALHAMIDAAERFDGVVSHRGDGIMAIFGAPSVSEDHGLRACLAALTMRDALTGGGARAGMVTEGVRGRDVRLRIGIHVGDVVFRPVRIGGAWTQDAVGIAVHVAARLEQSAEPGTICISGAAAATALGFIRTTPLEPIMVKGVDTPIERLELIEAERAANRWAVRAARGLSSFVGRGEERAALEAALVATGRRGVHIQGGPGIGKSRLLHEFLADVPTRTHHAVTLVGDHHRRFVPFHPVSAWLRGWLDIRLTDEPGQARAKLAARLPGWAAADADALARILNLTDAAAVALPGTLAAVDLGRPLAELLRMMAAGRRMILVCDDADRFDPATQDVVDDALWHLAEDDILVVTAGRGAVNLSPLPAGRTSQINLAPLSDAEGATLLGRLNARYAEQPDLAAAIIRKAGGNPLFIEEVAPRAGDTDAIADIPDRVEALIADRLTSLPRPLRRVLEVAAVIGNDVPVRLLAPLAGLPGDGLRGALATLQSEQVLYESARYPEAVFSFKHARTRDVAYKAMLAARRRAEHARIVTVLEAEGEAARARNSDDLANHALLARLWGPAVDYLALSARQAVSRSAYRSAMAALVRAREVAANELEDTEETARLRLSLLMNLQVLIQVCGGYADMLPVLEEAETIARGLADRDAQARLLATRVHVLNILGRLDEAIELGERARSTARTEGNVRQMIQAGFFTGQTYFNVGRLDAAEGVLSDILAEMESSRSAPTHGADALAVHGSLRTMRPQAHGTRAMVRALRADFAHAAADVDAAMARAGDSPRPYERIFAVASAGFVALQRRDHVAAAAQFRRVLDLSDEAEIDQMRSAAMACLGHALLMGGETAAASEILTAAHRRAGAEQRRMMQVGAATGLSLASLVLGEPDLARSFAEEAVTLADRHGFAAFRVHALRALGVARAVTAGEEAAGHAVLDQALAEAARLGMRADVAHAHAALALVRAPGRAAHLEAALGAYQALGLGPWAARVRDEVAANRLAYV